MMANKLLQYYEAKHNVAGELFDLVSDSLQSVLDASRDNDTDELSTRIDILKSNFRILLVEFPIFDNLKEVAVSDDDQELYHSNEDSIQSVFDHIALRLKPLAALATEMRLGNRGADIAIMDRHVAGILKIRLEGLSKEAALTQIYDEKIHREIIETYRSILLGIHILQQDTTVEIQYETIDTVR